MIPSSRPRFVANLIIMDNQRGEEQGGVPINNGEDPVTRIQRLENALREVTRDRDNEKQRADNLYDMYVQAMGNCETLTQQNTGLTKNNEDLVGDVATLTLRNDNLKLQYDNFRLEWHRLTNQDMDPMLIVNNLKNQWESIGGRERKVIQDMANNHLESLSLQRRKEEIDTKERLIRALHSPHPNTQRHEEVIFLTRRDNSIMWTFNGGADHLLRVLDQLCKHTNWNPLRQVRILLNLAVNRDEIQIEHDYRPFVINGDDNLHMLTNESLKSLREIIFDIVNQNEPVAPTTNDRRVEIGAHQHQFNEIDGDVQEQQERANQERAERERADQERAEQERAERERGQPEHAIGEVMHNQAEITINNVPERIEDNIDHNILEDSGVTLDEAPLYYGVLYDVKFDDGTGFN